MKLSTRCTLCNHPDRERINYLILLERVRVQDLCEHYGFSESAVYRHRHHLEASLEQAREAQRRLVAEELLENLSKALSVTWQVIDAAQAAGDGKLALAGVREVTRITKTIQTQMDKEDTELTDLTVYHAMTTEAAPASVTSLETPTSFRQRRRRFIRDTFNLRCHDDEHEHQVFQAIHKEFHVMPPASWKEIADFILNDLDPEGLRFKVEPRWPVTDDEYEPDPEDAEGYDDDDENAEPAADDEDEAAGEPETEESDAEASEPGGGGITPPEADAAPEAADKWETSGRHTGAEPSEPASDGDLEGCINLTGNPGESSEVPPLAPVSYRRPGPPPEPPLSPEEFAKVLQEMNEGLCRSVFAPRNNPY